MTEAEWLARGREILDRRGRSGWELVEWVRDGDAAMPAATVREAAERIGMSPGKFCEYRTISRSYALFRRRNTLGVSAVAAAIPLSEDDRDRVLDRAEAEGLTRLQLRDLVREVSGRAERNRLRAEVREVRRRLKAAEADPLGTAAAARRRVAGLAREAIGAYRDLACALELLAGEEALLERMHGNARRGLVRNLRRSVDSVAAACDELAVQRIAPALARVGGAEAEEGGQ